MFQMGNKFFNYILSDKKIALVKILLVPYQKALKFVLSVSTIILPRPIRTVLNGTEFFIRTVFSFDM